ncbi:MAG: acyl--CoA ligase, partial [Clostridia bacterium]|nr:acyl--CoA ligase [Clostridia bacterium]
MPITDILRKNAEIYGDEVCLVEINPELQEKHERTWREFELVETGTAQEHRREMTWREFDARANKFANLLISRGIGKGDKVAVLLMNCLEWLPVYFGVLKTGAIVVPMNYRYAADEILYCLGLADADAFVFGPEFTERVAAIKDKAEKVKQYFFVGSPVPEFADDYEALIASQPDTDPDVELCDDDYAAIYFSSGTTGFPKAILHKHRSLVHSCAVEQNHHGQQHDDCFLCIPPLYHTGAKMHWFGSFLVGGKAVLLRGVKPEWILRAVSDENCSIVWLLVPWAQDLLD